MTNEISDNEMRARVTARLTAIDLQLCDWLTLNIHTPLYRTLPALSLVYNDGDHHAECELDRAKAQLVVTLIQSWLDRKLHDASCRITRGGSCSCHVAASSTDLVDDVKRP